MASNSTTDPLPFDINNPFTWDWGAITKNWNDTKMVGLALFVWVVYDMTLTFGDSITLFYNQPWTASRLLFHLNQYNTVLLTMTVALSVLYDNANPVFCKGYPWVIYTGSSIMVLVVGVTLLGRVYALWNKDRRVTIPVTIIFLLHMGAYLSVLAYQYSSTTSLPQVAPYSGCFITLEWFNGFAVIFTSMFFETVVIILTIIKSWPVARQSGVTTPLFTLLLEDGLAYYFLIIAAQMIGAISRWVPALIGPVNAALPALSASGIACNRMLLRLQCLLLNRQRYQDSRFLEVDFWSAYISGDPYIAGAQSLPGDGAHSTKDILSSDEGMGGPERKQILFGPRRSISAAMEMSKMDEESRHHHELE